MARIRSARKSDAPLRTPRRKTSALPASLRMSAPSFAIRRAICLSLNAFLTRFFNGNLVQIAAARHFEGLGDLDAGDADDSAAPDEQRNPVARFDGDFTINQEILQLFLLFHAERLELVARPSISDRERRVRAFWKLKPSSPERSE